MKQYNNSKILLFTEKTFNENIRRAIQHLKKYDKKLAEVIDKVGFCTLKPQTDPFESIIDAIISQQLSMHSAQAIYDRFVNFFHPKNFPEPEDILNADIEELRKLGISYAKIRSIKDLSEKVLKGEIPIQNINELSDDEIIFELTKVRGIGRWTVHMFMIFSLGRLDVLPTEDLGIKKGIKKLYGLKKLPDEKKVKLVAQKNKWHPYCSIASWYIWRSLEFK